MKAKKLIFLIALISCSLSSQGLFSQTVLPVYKDSSQTITKEDLFQEKAQIKKNRESKKGKKSCLKVFQSKKRDAKRDSMVSKKEYNDERKTQNIRKNAGNKSQKNYNDRNDLKK